MQHPRELTLFYFVLKLKGALMNEVEKSKCKKCAKIRHVSELKDKPSGVGMVCIDVKLCKKEQSNPKTTES